MLLGMAVFLFASLATSIDSLMTKAETPHFLQMHTGEHPDIRFILHQKNGIHGRSSFPFSVPE